MRPMVCVIGSLLFLPVAAAPQEAAMDTASLATGPTSEATTLLEKTLFRIDVARLRIRFGPETAGDMANLLARGAAGGNRAVLEDALAHRALRAIDAWAILRFERGIGFERFVDGIRDGVEVARRAGYVDPSFARSLSDSLPGWYARLRQRGVKEGDVMMYRIRGDTLRTVFRTVEGDLAVDQTDVGTQPRLAVLGGFFGPGSDFRAGLLASLLAAVDRGGGGEDGSFPSPSEGIPETRVPAAGPAEGGA